MKRNVMTRLGLSILLTALVFLAIPKGVAQAGGIPPTPHAFYGDLLTTGGGAAPAGVVVRAKVNGEWASDPVTTTEVGKYGGPSLLDPKLIVQGYILDGTPIEFYVDGVLATPDDPDKAKFYSGEITELGLTYTPPARDAGGPVVPPAKLAINWALLGVVIAAIIVAGLLVYFFTARRRV